MTPAGLFQDLRILCTFISEKEKRQIQELARSEGAYILVTTTANDPPHVIITRRVGSPKYYATLRRNPKTPVVTPEWITSSINKKKRLPFSDFAVGIFYGLTICFSGLDISDKARLTKIVHNNGGTHSGSLSRDCTHLVTISTTSDKYHFAREHKIACLTPSWITASVQHGWCQEEKNHAVSSSDLQQFSILQRENSILLPGFTMPSTSGLTTAGGDICSKGHCQQHRGGCHTDEQLPTHTTVQKFDHVNPRTTVAVAAASTMKIATTQPALPCSWNDLDCDDTQHPFLESCYVWVAGCSATESFEALKLCRQGGAKRFVEPHPTLITHVVIGSQLTRREAEEISRYCSTRRYVPVLGVDWLSACIIQGGVAEYQDGGRSCDTGDNIPDKKRAAVVRHEATTDGLMAASASMQRGHRGHNAAQHALADGITAGTAMMDHERCPPPLPSCHHDAQEGCIQRDKCGDHDAWHNNGMIAHGGVSMSDSIIDGDSRSRDGNRGGSKKYNSSITRNQQQQSLQTSTITGSERATSTTTGFLENCYFTLVALSSSEDRKLAEQLIRVHGGRLFTSSLPHSVHAGHARAFAICPPSLVPTRVAALRSSCSDFAAVPEQARFTMYWLECCVHARQVLVPQRGTPCFQPLPFALPMPGMEIVSVSISGYSIPVRAAITHTIQTLGGHVSTEFMTSKDTHLIVPSAQGQKYVNSHRFGVVPVTADWLVDSVAYGKIQPEENYKPRSRSTAAGAAVADKSAAMLAGSRENEQTAAAEPVKQHQSTEAGARLQSNAIHAQAKPSLHVVPLPSLAPPPPPPAASTQGPSPLVVQQAALPPGSKSRPPSLRERMKRITETSTRKRGALTVPTAATMTTVVPPSWNDMTNDYVAGLGMGPDQRDKPSAMLGMMPSALGGGQALDRDGDGGKGDIIASLLNSPPRPNSRVHHTNSPAAGAASGATTATANGTALVPSLVPIRVPTTLSVIKKPHGLAGTLTSNVAKHKPASAKPFGRNIASISKRTSTNKGSIVASETQQHDADVMAALNNVSSLLDKVSSKHASRAGHGGGARQGLTPDHGIISSTISATTKNATTAAINSVVDKDTDGDGPHSQENEVGVINKYHSESAVHAGGDRYAPESIELEIHNKSKVDDDNMPGTSGPRRSSRGKRKSMDADVAAVANTSMTTTNTSMPQLHSDVSGIADGSYRRSTRRRRHHHHHQEEDVDLVLDKNNARVNNNMDGFVELSQQVGYESIPNMMEGGSSIPMLGGGVVGRNSSSHAAAAKARLQRAAFMARQQA